MQLITIKLLQAGGSQELSKLFRLSSKQNQLSYYHESLRQNQGKGMAGHQAQSCGGDCRYPDRRHHRPDHHFVYGLRPTINEIANLDKNYCIKLFH